MATGSVLVFGASSQIGYCLLPRLAGEGARVLAVSRAPQANVGNVRWLRGSLPDALDGTFGDIEAIVSFAPLDGLAVWLARAPLPVLKRVVATSSMSVESKRESPVAAEREVARRLREGERALARVCEARNVAWTILRPTLIYGVGRDRSLTPLAQRAVRTRVFVLPAGSGLRQPVHAQDVTEAVMAALRTPQAAGRIIPVGGGERLPVWDMFARVRASLPVRTVPLTLPRSVGRIAMRALPALRGPLSRLDEDLIADNRELQDLLGVQPRGFNLDARMWLLPPQAHVH